MERSRRGIKGYTTFSRRIASLFDKDSWQEWLGTLPDPKPFTIGLRLTEPPDGNGPWILDVTLRSKRDENIIETYTGKKLPRGWNKYASEVVRATKRWQLVVPWLGENGRLKRRFRKRMHGSS